MMNILLCGNKKVFDGALSELISITNKTKEPITCYIYTMHLENLNPDFLSIEDKQVEFLDKVVKLKNSENKVIKVDVTDLYNQEFGGCKNETAYCTPYTLLRLLADLVPNMPDKLLYLDVDMMAGGDISELYSTDVTDVEYAAVKEKYGCIFLYPDYINAGMLLFNMNKVKETNLLGKSRELLRNRKLLFADQSAVYYSTTKKILLPRKFNEQSSFKRDDTIICHFCKRLVFTPLPHTSNFKQWHIDQIHKVFKCYKFDDDLNEYVKLKAEFEGNKLEEKVNG